MKKIKGNKIRTTKFIVATLLVVALLVVLTACGTTTPTRGQWEGDVFTSEYLGFSFELPERWIAATDAEIAGFMGVAETLRSDAGAAIPEDVELHYDMMASNPFSGDYVLIMFERHGGLRAPTRASFIEMMTESLAEEGVRLIDVPGTTRIGNDDWYSFETELDIMGMTISGQQFFSISGGYIRVIMFIVMPDSPVSVGDIIANFNPLP